jgi:gliding motility-associated-like protein
MSFNFNYFRHRNLQKMKHLFTILLLSCVSLITKHSAAQSILFNEDFESSGVWQNYGTSTPNTWIIGSCVSNTGSQSAYISSGGTTNDCTASGINHYGYVNAVSGNQSTIFARPVTTSCVTNLYLEFYILIDGNAQDFAEVVYSTDNGNSWTATGPQFTAITVYQQNIVTLPPTLNNTSFLLGFRFNYDNSIVNGNPASVDNVRLFGTVSDIIPPTAICPPNILVYANAACEVSTPDILPFLSLSDNCTPAGYFYNSTQTPAIGTVLTDTTAASITVFDLAGLTALCNTSLIFIDTIQPSITCPADQNGYVGSNCNFPIPDYTNLVVSTDNCSSTFTVNQIPAPATTFTDGVYVITMVSQDASGNQNSCQFQFEVIDTISPSIVCPSGQTAPSNFACVSFVGDYASLATINDNCSPAFQMVVQQSPANLTAFSSNQLVTLSVQDLSGNTASCQFTVTSIDTTGPTINCLSDTNLVISNPCNYTIPNFVGTHSAFDNCTASGLLSFSQNPLPGVAANSITPVSITYTDQTGNSSTCITTIYPIDIIPPTITCAPNQVVNNVALCTSTLPNMVPGVIVSDNCSDFTITQSPVAGTVLSAGANPIIFTIIDAGGNQQTCTSYFTITETIAPTITCPGNITTCNPLVSYSPPAIVENCNYLLSQTDLTGFTSGDIFPVGSTIQTYTVVDSSGNSDVCSFTINVSEYPDTALVINPTILMCNIFDTVVTAQTINSGTGSWQVVQGSATLSNPNSLQTNVTNCSIGTNLIVWTVSSPTCGSTKDTVTIIVNSPNSQAALIDTLVVCSETGDYIQANVPTSGTGTWTTISSIIFEDNNSPITDVSNVPEGFSEVFWTISNVACPSTSDSAIVYRPNTAVIATNDTTLCKEDLPYYLSGTLPGLDQFPSWNFIQGSGSMSNQYTSSTNLTNGQSGILLITYTLSHQTCDASIDTIEIGVSVCSSVFTNIPTLFTPNGDGDNDVFEIDNLHTLYPNCEVKIVNRWGNVVYESVGYAEPWDGRFKGEDLPLGTYFYSITSPDDSFEDFSGSISIIR